MNERLIDKYAYKRAYARLRRFTPITADCGRLCRKRCCKGGMGEGMILFPGEPLFGSLSVTDKVMCGFPVRFAVCKGRCKRETRPLSCRIYPFAPYLGADGRLNIIADPRAKYICPLLAESAQALISRRFLIAVEAAFDDLLYEENMIPMLEAYARMLDEYRRFTG